MRDLGVLPAFDPAEEDQTDPAALQLGDISDISPANAPGVAAAVNPAPVEEEQPLSPPPLPPTHDDMAQHLPDTVPVMPAHGDLIRAYLESKLSLPQGPDPKLAQAQMEEKIDRAANSIGRAAGGLGTAITGGAAGFANQVAGKGYDTSGGMQSPVQAYDDKASPVQRYMQSKLAEQQASKANLEDAQTALAAHKAMLGQDPNSIEAARLDLAKKQYEREVAKDADTSTHNRWGEGHGNESLEEQKRWHDVEAALRAKGFTAREADDEIKRQRLALAQNRDARQEIKTNDTESQGVVNLADEQRGILPAGKADEANTALGATVNVRQSIGKIRNILADAPLMSRLSFSEQNAKLEPLVHELSTQWNGALSRNVLAGPRAEAIKDAIGKLGGIEGVVRDAMSSIAQGHAYSDTRLAAIDDMIDANARNLAQSRGVKLGKTYEDAVSGKPQDIGHTPRVRTAAPGRVGSGTGPGEASASGGDAMVTVKSKKTGSVVRMPASKAKAYQGNPDFEVR